MTESRPRALLPVDGGRVWCPYARCGFGGTENEVDDHRATGVHNDQPQAGSNLRHRPMS